MSEMQIGPICFRNGHGSILAGRFYYDLRDNPHGIVSEPIGFADDDLVVTIRILEPDQAKAAARRLRPGTGLGGVLSAWHFDPPEDHPEEPEFDYLDAVIYDFREINDHLDTLEGVRGPHFTSLLEWQPKIDPARTALFALVTPGTLSKVRWKERGAASRLAATFDANGYDAVILTGYDHTAAELAILTHFATEMAAAVNLPLIIATPSRLVNVPHPFAMNFTIGGLF